MADTNFVDKSTIIQADWCNDVNKTVYHAVGNGSIVPSTPLEVRTNLGVETTVENRASFSSSSGADQVGFLQDGTGAVLTTLKKEVGKRVSVTQFGAKGDGVTDDTASIQAAINYAISIASLSSPVAIDGYGVQVYFPAGSYRVTSSVTITNHGIGLVGDQGKGTKITGDCILFDVGDYSNARRVRSVSFSHLNLVCSNTAGTAAAIKLYRTTSINFEEVNFISWKIGIDCYRASTTEITGCWCNNSLRTAQATAWIRMQGTDETLSTGTIYTPGGGMHITDCEVVGVSSAAAFDTDAGILVHSCDGLYLTQTHFSGCVTGLDIAPTATPENHTVVDVFVENCYFDDPSILSTTRNIYLRGTVKRTVTMADSSSEVSIYQGFRFSNCQFRGSASATYNGIIQVQDGDTWFNSSRRLQDITFTGCTFKQALETNFRVYGGASNTIEPYNLVIVGCVFESGNSNGTGSIGAAISANVESAIISGNIFGSTSGNSDFIVNVSAVDVGTADNPNPAVTVVGNDLSKATVVNVSSGNPEPVRIVITGSTNSNTLQADNLYTGYGRRVKQQYKLTTTDATTTNIWSFSIPPAVSGSVTATISGSNVDGTKAVVYQFFTGFRNNGTASSLSTGTSSWTSVRAWNPDTIGTVPVADLSTDTLRARVTGVVGETWTWVCDIDLSGSK